MSELDRSKALYDVLKSETDLQAKTNRDWEKSATSLRTKLEAALKEKATMSVAIEAKDKEIKTLREGPGQ